MTLTDQQLHERAEKIAITFSGPPTLLWRQKIYRAVLRQLTKVRDQAEKCDCRYCERKRFPMIDKAKEWLTQRNIPLEWPYYTNNQYHTLKLAEELAAYAQSQSSRVQELEVALRVVIDHLTSGVQWHPDDDGRVRGTITHAERALAGKKEK